MRDLEEEEEEEPFGLGEDGEAEEVDCVDERGGGRFRLGFGPVVFGLICCRKHLAADVCSGETTDVVEDKDGNIR